jgi:hypothetical protein
MPPADRSPQARLSNYKPNPIVRAQPEVDNLGSAAINVVKIIVKAGLVIDQPGWSACHPGQKSSLIMGLALHQR